VGEEGCLSIPGFREDVSRAKKAVVRAFNVKGETIEVEGEDLLARAMQHEIDHLNGILFLSHLSPLKRDLIKRKIKKLIREHEWD
jgi:peptide deformylase